MSIHRSRGVGTGEAGEALASPEFRGFTSEKFLASWIYEGGNFSCFTGKKLLPTPLHRRIDMLIIDRGLLLLCRIRFSVTKGISYQLLYSSVIVYFCSSSSFCLYSPINTCRVDGCKQGYVSSIPVRAKN